MCEGVGCGWAEERDRVMREEGRRDEGRREREGGVKWASREGAAC